MALLALLVEGLGVVMLAASWLVYMFSVMVVFLTLAHVVHKNSNLREDMLTPSMDVPGQVIAQLFDAGIASHHHTVFDLWTQNIQPVHEHLFQLCGPTVGSNLQ